MKRIIMVLTAGVGAAIALGGCGGTIPGLHITTPTVEPGNQYPLADAGPDVNAQIGELVELEAGGSSDPDGNSLSYTWAKTDGPPTDLRNANQRVASFVPTVAGQYQFSITVNDGHGGIASDTVRVSVADAGPGAQDLPPTADAGPDLAIFVGDLVELNGSGSSNPTGGALTYQWQQAAGSAITLIDADQNIARFTPAAAGAYEFALTVTNTSGRTDQDVVAVTVSDRPAPRTYPIQSTFDADHESWRVWNNTHGTQPVWVSDAGGEYIGVPDGTYGTQVWYFDAPAEFLGDLSGAFGGHLSFNLASNRPLPYITAPLVALTGDSRLLVCPVPYIPGTGWTAYSVRLDESGGWKNAATGLAATPAEVQDVLANLVQLRIRGDFGSTDLLADGFLDDVVITAP